MARGWESKSVEQQQESASFDAGETRARLTPAEIEAEQRRRGLELSRRRTLCQLEAVSNPRHRQMLEAALADLDAKLEEQ